MSERRFLLALFVLALVLRCGFSLAYGLGAAPAAWGDDADYDAIASHLVASHQYHNSWFPPGYPFFLAMIYALFGHSYAAVRLLQAALGAATCCVLYLIGRNTFGPAVGRISGLAMALWPGQIYMAWRLMSETLFTLLIALGVAAARRPLAAAQPPRAGAGGPHAARRAAVLGLLLGASTLVKSNLVVFPVLVLGWLAVSALLAAPALRRRRLAAAAAALAGCVLVLLLDPLANRLSLTPPAAARAGGPVALMPGNAGPTLWWSNNPLADGYFVDPDDSAAGRDFIARHGLAAAMKDPDPFVRDRAARRLALDWIAENPGDFCRLVLRKLWNAYGPAPHAAVLARSALAQRLQLISWSALLPLAAAGLVLARRRWRAALPLHLVLLASVVMTVVFYGTPRFTLPVMPYFLVFAACALSAASMRLNSRRRAAFPASSSPAIPPGSSAASAASACSGVLERPWGL